MNRSSRLVLLVATAATAVACRHDATPVAAPATRLPAAALVRDVAVTELGTLGGTTFALAMDVSSRLAAVGSSSISPGQDLPYHAFVWTAADGMTDLGTLGGPSSSGRAVNALGQIVGTADRPDGLTRAVIWSPGEPVRDLGDLGGPRSFALGLNSIGHVVGQAYTAASEPHAFQWTAETGMRDLGTLGGVFSAALATNVFAQVVGLAAVTPGAFEFHAVMWSEATGLADLGTLGGVFAQAQAINDLGQVVGSSTTDPSRTTPNDQLYRRAFLWTRETGMLDLGSLPGDLYSHAADINNLGMVVGTSYNDVFADGRAFLWTPEGGFVNLPGLGGAITTAHAISDVIGTVAYVVGGSELPSGELHAVLWTVELTPSTPSETMESLTDQVENAVSVGALADGAAAALLSVLAAATRQIDRGNLNQARSLVGAFLNQVEAYAQSGRVSAETAASLLAAGRAVLESISS